MHLHTCPYSHAGTCYILNMDIADCTEIIRRHADDIKAQGATALFIYGSRARGNNGDESDLDVYVDYDASQKFSLMDLASIKLLIEDETGLSVHITTRDSLHPMLKADIESEAIRVF